MADHTGIYRQLMSRLQVKGTLLAALAASFFVRTT